MELAPCSWFLWQNTHNAGFAWPNIWTGIDTINAHNAGFARPNIWTGIDPINACNVIAAQVSLKPMYPLLLTFLMPSYHELLFIQENSRGLSALLLVHRRYTSEFKQQWTICAHIHTAILLEKKRTKTKHIKFLSDRLDLTAHLVPSWIDSTQQHFIKVPSWIHST